MGEALKAGDDVWVDFDGGTFRGEILKVENSGYLLCRMHTDPTWDFGRASSYVDPEQIVAVRNSRIRRYEHVAKEEK